MVSPISGSNNTTLLKVLDTEEIAQRWYKQLGIDVGNTFRSIDKLEYWMCNDTGLRWYEPPEAAGSSHLYSQLEKYEWYYMSEKWEFVKTINSFIPNSNVLEVGSGRGYFIELAQKAGHSAVGIESNLSAVSFARERGLNISSNTLAELYDSGHSFDYICAFQVLEHLPNPRQFLLDVIRLLKPNGHLFLSTPNHFFMQKIDPLNQDLLNQPPHHMSHWDKNVFKSLEKYLPLQVVSIEYEPLASYHVEWATNGYLKGLLTPLFPKLITRLIFNRYTTLPIHFILRAGLRKFLIGHTILVDFVKISG